MQGNNADKTTLLLAPYFSKRNLKHWGARHAFGAGASAIHWRHAFVNDGVGRPGRVSSYDAFDLLIDDIVRNSGQNIRGRGVEECTLRAV